MSFSPLYIMNYKSIIWEVTSERMGVVGFVSSFYFIVDSLELVS